MKRLLAALVMVLAFGGAARADDWADCSGADANLSIPGCSKIIAARRKNTGNLATAYNNRGVAYNSMGDYDRAITDFDKAIRLNPDYAYAFNGRGAAYGDKGDQDRAIADYDKAIQLKPDYDDAYYNRGNAYYRKGEPAKALTDFRIAAQLIPVSNQHHDQALARIAELEKQLAAVAPGVSAVAPASQASASLGRRVALVIGNGAYASRIMPRLSNPPHDAVAIGNALETLGFDVDVVTDATKQTMEDALARLARKARDADVTLIFYAGHGLQDQGKNYFAPVDAVLTDETDLRHRFIRLDDVLDDLAEAKGAPPTWR